VQHSNIEEILPGIWRIPVPLPFRPRIVHAYLVRVDRSGFLLVDGGPRTPDAWAALSGAIEAIDGWSRLRLHVVTHMHLDHVGLALDVRSASSVPLALGALDAERWIHAHAHPDEEDEYRAAFLAMHGVDPGCIAGAQRSARDSWHLAPFVAPDHHLSSDGGPLPRLPEWSSLWTPGHTAGHVSLFREEGRVLISGDVVLPGITPTVGVNRQRLDPVADQLESLARIEALRPEIVLGGHGDPLRGFDRARELRDDLLAETERVAEILDREPTTAWMLSHRRFPERDLPPSLRIHALREILAHLEHLVMKRRAVRLLGRDRLVRFARPRRLPIGPEIHSPPPGTAATLHDPTIRRSDDPTIRRSDDPTIRRSDDPTIRRSEDPKIRRSEDPKIRRSEDPKIRRSEDPTIRP